MVTCYRTKVTASYLAIIDVLHGIVTFLFRDRVVVAILLITRSLESVETGLMDEDIYSSFQYSVRHYLTSSGSMICCYNCFQNKYKPLQNGAACEAFLN